MVVGCSQSQFLEGPILHQEEPEELTHRCRAGQRCAARTSDGAAITMGPDTLCHSCVGRLQEQLDQLSVIGHVLRLYLVRGGSSAQTKVAFTSEPAPPLNVHALDLIDEVAGVIKDIGGLRVADLIRHPDGVRRALAIGKAWRKSDGVIGISRAWQQRLAPCPKCHLRNLGSFAGEESIHCSSCGDTMTRQEYSKICIITASKK